MIFEDWIDVLETERWDNALRDIPHGYWHSRRACQVASVNTGNPVYLYVARSDKQTIACPLMERNWKGHRDYTTPIGFSGFASNCGQVPTDFLARWSSALFRNGGVCAYLAQHPLYASPAPQQNETFGSTLFIIDLNSSPTEWLKQIVGNKRRSIRAWEETGSPWIRDRALLAQFAIEHHNAVLTTFNASSASHYTDDALQLLCDDPEVELTGVADQDGICSVAAFGSTPWGCEMLFHISIRSGRSFTAALVWWAVQHYHGRVPTINLGGTARENDTVAAAKRRYRPREMPFRKLKTVLDQLLYDQLCAETNVAADDLSGYFPAYRQAYPVE